MLLFDAAPNCLVAGETCQPQANLIPMENDNLNAFEYSGSGSYIFSDACCSYEKWRERGVIFLNFSKFIFNV